MIPPFSPFNFIYSVLGLDVNDLKSMLKFDFKRFLSKLIFPPTSRLLFFIHTLILLF